jgi:hypothetical protein
MNVVEISAAEAFNPGSDLWVVKNDFKNSWWNELDFRSGFLLSHCLVHTKKAFPAKITELLELTELKKYSFSEDQTNLLLGSSDHFLNKWILIWDNNPEKIVEKLEQMALQLKTNSVRFFSDSELLMGFMEARRKTSLTNITYIENT